MVAQFGSPAVSHAGAAITSSFDVCGEECQIPVCLSSGTPVGDKNTSWLFHLGGYASKGSESDENVLHKVMLLGENAQ